MQRRYADFLPDWRTDLGGKRNFRNGVGGTYDCIAILSYYAVCKAVTSFREIEENLILPSFRKLKFVDCNKLFWQKLMYKAFLRAKVGCDKWHDYEMSLSRRMCTLRLPGTVLLLLRQRPLRFMGQTGKPDAALTTT